MIGRVVFFAIIALVAICMSPIPDHALMTVKLDQMAYNVCWNRFGVLFPQRWSCESTIKSNAIALALGCAFKRQDMLDVCAEFDKVKEADSTYPPGFPRNVTQESETGCVIHLAQFQALKTGMSYAAAASTLGCEGTEMSRLELPDAPQFATVMYSWKGAGIANANAMFQNDKLINKAQFGL